MRLRHCGAVCHIYKGRGERLTWEVGGGVVDGESKMRFQRRKMENGFEEGEA